MKKSVLLIGGAGYIGSHIAKELHKNGFTPIVLDRDVAKKPWSDRYGPSFNCDLPKELNFLEGIITRYSIDSCIHLGANTLVGESVLNPSKYYINNVVMTLALLNRLNELGLKKIIFSSSAAVYGMPNGLAREDAVPNPINPYGRSKYYVEEILKDYNRAYNFNSISLRYFNVSGISADAELGEVKPDEGHLIPNLIESARQSREFTLFGTDFDTADGTCVRDYVNVEDVAEAHLLALLSLNNDNVCERYNIASGVGTSNLELIKKVEKYYGPMDILKLGRRDGDPAELVADITKAKEQLKWSPSKSSIDNIVRSVVQWYNKTHQKELN